MRRSRCRRRRHRGRGQRDGEPEDGDAAVTGAHDDVFGGIVVETGCENPEGDPIDITIIQKAAMFDLGSSRPRIRMNPSLRLEPSMGAGKSRISTFVA